MDFLKKHLWLAVLLAVFILALASVITAGAILAVNVKIVSLQSRTPSSDSSSPAKPEQTTASGQAQSCSPYSGGLPGALDISTDSPGVKTKSNKFYYKVYGNTANQVRDQLNSCGQQTSEGIFDASTNYELNYKFLYKSFPESESCGIQNIAVGLNIYYIFPQWVDNGDKSLLDRWNSYISNLTIHEEGHGKIDEQCARDLLGDLSTLGNFSSCNEAQAKADEDFDRILSDCQKKNNDYDSQTGHGATQGAVFP